MISDRAIGGYALDPDEPETRFVVELWLDGSPAAISRAHIYEARLAAEGAGDGCYGFRFALDPAWRTGVRWAEVRLANSGEALAAPFRIGAAEAAEDDEPALAEARWSGGLRLTGWVQCRDGGERPRLRALVDGVVVAEGFADGWTQVCEGDSAFAARAFALDLPSRMADGRLRRARVIDENGRDLPGSPCAFVAFEDGLQRFLASRGELESERLRARLWDRLFPQCYPFSDFAGWSRRFPLATPARQRRPRVAVAFCGDVDATRSLESLSGQADCDWVACELAAAGGPTAFEPADLRGFLESQAQGAEFVVLAPAGVAFEAHALARLGEALEAFPGAKLAYGDLILEDETASWPIAFGAFDYERMMEQGYCAFVFAMRAADAIAATEEGAGDLFRMFMRPLDGMQPRAREAVVHTPGFLARLPPPEVDDGAVRLARAVEAHLGSRGIAASAKPSAGLLFPAVRVSRPRSPGKVSIVIPTRGELDRLRPCLDNIAATTSDVETEIVVVDNGSASDEARGYLEQVSSTGVRVARAGGSFDHSRLLRAGASVASGEFLLLARDDLDPLRPGWLAEMLGRMAEPDVGAVGAMLIAPSGVILHGGVTLGPDVSAAVAFADRMEGDPGYSDLLLAAHECSAVSAACLLTRRRLFQELGGLDGARFPSGLSEVDFCLRMRASGRRIVFTPHAGLRLRDPAGLARLDRSLSEDRLRRERDRLCGEWGEALVDDPAYSPLLTLQAPYAGLAWPPRPCAPRLPHVAPPRRTPPGF